MKLFDNDIFNISRIYRVDKYVTTDSVVNKNIMQKYSSNPKAYEMIFFVSGENTTHFCGINIKDCENSLRYLPKGNFEGKYEVKSTKPGYCIDVYFDTYEDMPQTAVGFQNFGFLKDYFIKIYKIWNEKKTDYYIKSMRVMYDIILEMRKKRRKYMNMGQYAMLNNAERYIKENYTKSEFDYRALCAESGLSYSYFSELFIKRYGMSPVKYVTKLKIDYAKELLVTNMYSITKIAEMCGFEDVYYFSNVFKKLNGVSPKKYLN